MKNYACETKQGIGHYDLLVSWNIISKPMQSLFYANAHMTSMRMMALCGVRVSGAFQWQRNSFLILYFPRLYIAQYVG